LAPRFLADRGPDFWVWMPLYGLWLAVWTYSLLDLSFADMFLKPAFNPIYDLRRNCYGVLEFDGNIIG
jgi:hypothetical protein